MYPRGGFHLAGRPPFVARTLAPLATDLLFRLAAALPLQHARPVELEIRIARFEKTDRFLVQGAAPDANAGRRAKPVEDARPPPAAPATRLNDERVLVSALVFVEAELWQDYFLLDVFAVFFTAGRTTRFAAGRFAVESVAAFLPSRSGFSAALAGLALRISTGVAR